LESAIDCLQKVGYSRTTTQLISQTSHISRGAMLHHYATKQDLISAVIDYTFYKRMELFTPQIQALTETQRVQEQAGIEVFWNSIQTREYEAYLELSVAARTDDELREIFMPKAARYDKVWRDEIARIFPEWGGKLDQLNLAIDVVLVSMEGLMLNRDIWDEAQKAVLRRFINRAVLMLRHGDLGMPTL
jgi:AcrR family transcriptional regulator